MVNLNRENNIWLDEEYLLKPIHKRIPFFINDNILYGYGLILGNDYGESCNCNLTIEEVQDLVEFD